MSFQLNRNLKFTNTDYGQKPFQVGDIVAIKYGTDTIIGRVQFIDEYPKKYLFIAGHGFCFHFDYTRLATKIEIDNFLYALHNYGDPFYIKKKHIKPKHSIKDIIGKVLCFIPIPFFGLFWFMFYGVSREKLISNSLLAGALFVLHTLSFILGFMLMIIFL